VAGELRRLGGGGGCTAVHLAHGSFPLGARNETLGGAALVGFELRV
jgi:hypothetical protein